MNKPEWLKIKIQNNSSFKDLSNLLNNLGLNTVCQEALCPNLNKCWGKGTATFLIMGQLCTGSCKFCSIKKGKPKPLDYNEPKKIARAVKYMGLNYVVITSVNRDDLEDKGADHWAKTIQEIRKTNPSCKIEVLVPDFNGDKNSIDKVLAASPDVFAHNLETVQRIYLKVRGKNKYITSLKVLEYASSKGFLTKTGIMIGLGEKPEEIKETMKESYKAGVKIFTIGQYLQPTKAHLKVSRFVTPEEFEIYYNWGAEIGFLLTLSGPLVRSSYNAEKAVYFL